MQVESLPAMRACLQQYTYGREVVNMPTTTVDKLTEVFMTRCRLLSNSIHQPAEAHNHQAGSSQLRSMYLAEWTRPTFTFASVVKLRFEIVYQLPPAVTSGWLCPSSIYSYASTCAYLFTLLLMSLLICIYTLLLNYGFRVARRIKLS
jgi:hypothetical protein